MVGTNSRFDEGWLPRMRRLWWPRFRGSLGRNGFARAYARELRGYVVTPEKYRPLQSTAAFIGGPVSAVDRMGKSWTC